MALLERPCPCGCDRFEAFRPETPSAIVFIDGQNLFRQAQRCFGDHDVSHENYSPVALAKSLVRAGRLAQIRFYSGRPWAYRGNLAEADWGNALNRRISYYVHAEGDTFKPVIRDLAYRRPEAGSNRPVGREKGIDVALAIDVVVGAIEGHYDIAVILSQDRDLTEVAPAVSLIRGRSNRWTHLESAFPVPDTGDARAINARGLKGTRWVRISRDQYRTCCVGVPEFRQRYSTGVIVPFDADFEVVGHVRQTICRPAMKMRAAFRTGDGFPGCAACRGPVFWCRYSRARAEEDDAYGGA